MTLAALALPVTPVADCLTYPLPIVDALPPIMAELGHEAGFTLEQALYDALGELHETGDPAELLTVIAPHPTLQALCARHIAHVAWCCTPGVTLDSST